MKEFSFSTRIFFGEGALERLNKVRNKRVMIVTDNFMASSGVADRVAAHLQDCEVTVFSDVVPDPPIEVVAAGVQCFQQCQPEVMIAVGGGSVIDTAKAIAHGVADPSTDIWQYWSKKKTVTRSLPVGAVLTIPAAGSETSDSAVLTDTEQPLKCGLTTEHITS